MDVTRSTGAPRAADGRAPAARERGPGFEAFMALGERDAAPAREARRPAEDGRRIEQAERRGERSDARAERRRAEERAEARRAEERAADERRAAERRAEDRAAERRDARAERAADRNDERAAPRDPAQPREAEPSRRGPRAKARPQARPAAERDPAEPAELSGALGMAGLVEWLHRLAPEPIRAETPLDTLKANVAAQLDDAELIDPEGLPLDLDGAAEDAPEAEFTRLLEARSLSDALEPRGPARPTDTVRIGPRPTADGAPIAAPPPTAHRIADPGLAARAGATPTALPEGVDESSIMRQISDALRLREGRGDRQSAEIQLHPAELGRVRIRIQMEAGAARVHVVAEHAAVADLLGGGLDQLRRDLMAQGVQIAHLEVRSGLADDSGGQREAPEQEEAEERDAPAEAPRPTARRTRGRIDLEA